VIEFNARFGDPETQVILPLCDGDVLLALYAAATQSLTPDTLGWRAGAAACVVLSSAGYPNAPRSGDAITIDATKIPTNGTILHAGTRNVDGQLVTAGGRVLNAVGYGVDAVSALRTAYATVDAVRFAGMHYRLDIGQTELV
jgi:phosphoribosylamine--glycine ligase